jgi:hypothetical protein
MLLLRATTDLLQVDTGSAASIEVVRAALIADNAAPPAIKAIPDLGPMDAITQATTTTVVDTSAGTSGDHWNVKDLSFYNGHASQSTTLKVKIADNSLSPTRFVTLWNGTLLAGETLKLDETGMWTLYDSNGNVKAAAFPAATQADMEAGTSNSVSVTPQNINWHPGVAKAWAKHAVSGGVPQMSASWNVTSVTDSAVCRAAPVIATDFSSANYVVLYGFECNTTTYSATTTALIQTVRNATQAAGGFTMDLLEIDIGQTTDPASWHWVAFGDQ